MINNLKQLDPVQGLVDYVLDIKPYHTKIIEVLVEYVYEEKVNVTILDLLNMEVHSYFPFEEFGNFECDDGFSASPYGSGLTPVISPNQGISFVNYPAINPTTNTFIVSDNRAGDFLPGTLVNLSTLIEDYTNVHDINGVTSGPAGSGSFVVNGDQTTQFIPSYQFNVYNSQGNDKTYTVTTSTFAAGKTTINVAQAVVSSIVSGKLGLLISNGNNTGIFTVVSSVFNPGFIDSWPDVSDPSTYTLGNGPHTIIEVVEPLNSVPALGPNQLYTAFVSLQPLIVENVLPYSDALAKYNPSIPERLQTPDEGFLTKPIVDLSVVFSEFVVEGDLNLSNIFVNQTFQIKQSAGNNGLYTIVSFVYSSLDDETTITVAESIPSPVVDGVIIFDIASNAFVVDGDHRARFQQGVTFEIDGGALSKLYTTLYSDFVDGKTRIRPSETILQDDIVFVSASIKENLLGYSESSEICSMIPEGLVSVKIDEHIKMTGLGLDLTDDVIAYNIENNDRWGYDLPLGTIISPTTPVLLEQATPPLSPTLYDLWFDTSINKLRQWRGKTTYSDLPVWDLISTVFWMDTTNSLFYYRSKDSFIDTGWVVDFIGVPGFSIIAPAISDLELIDTQFFYGDGVTSTFTLTTPVPGSFTFPVINPSLLRVTINNLPAGITLNSSTEFTITSPVVEEDDNIIAKIFDHTGTQSNAHVVGFSSEPHKIFHNNVTPDVGNDAIVVGGGNFIQRFVPDNTIQTYNFSGPVFGFLSNLKAKTFPILTIDETTRTITINGDYVWLFQPGRIFNIRYSKNNYNEFVIESSTWDGTVTSIVTTTDVIPSESDLTADRNRIQDLGVILGAVYNPVVNAGDPNDQVKTIAAMSTSVSPILEGISYFWNGPVRMDIGLFPEDMVVNNIQDSLGMYNEMLTVPSYFEILNTNSTTNSFVIHYDDPATGLPVNLIDSFPPGTIFRVSGSYSDDNPNSSETNDSMWMVASVVWDYNETTMVGSGDTIITVVTDFDVLPPFNTFNVISVTNNGGGISGTNQIVLSGDHVKLFENYTPNEFKLNQPLINVTQSLNVMTILEVALVTGNTVLTIDEEIIDELFVGPLGILSSKFSADVVYDSTNTILPWVDGNIIKEELSINQHSDNLTSAFIEERIDFSWGTTHQWEIIATNQSLNSITLSGDLSNIIDVTDIGLISGSEDNDNEYEIQSVSYNIGPNETTVIFNSPSLLSDPPPGLLGYFILRDIDITNWFQYLIHELNSTTNTIKVFGNATADIQNGQSFRIFGTQNNGIYDVISSPVYDGLHTTISVTSVAQDENGGWVESLRDFGMRMLFSDEIGVTTNEEVTALVLSSGSPLVGAWDYPNWDIGGFDEDFGTVIHLYSNVF